MKITLGRSICAAVIAILLAFPAAAEEEAPGEGSDALDAADETSFSEDDSEAADAEDDPEYGSDEADEEESEE